LNKDEREKVGKILMRANNTMNPKIVGKTALYIAAMAGITVPTIKRKIMSCIRILYRRNLGKSM